ncbi:hypothetical protein [Sphingopyxis sp. KK2]|uniref:hypothetical protein n=1 Tax=Sphingopyxis sp. KK2 TaxID=1855727 RepID=UPI00097E6A37|nr:hypothetical protein [Sphingopyxis sp. KK2]
MDRDALLIRYRVMSDIRLHFSRLYFAVVAFSILLTAALWALFPVVEALALIGWVPVAGAFVAHRLLLRERSAFAAMTAAWRALSGEAEPARARSAPGAMALVLVGEVLAGLVLAGIGAINWLAA